LAGVGATDFDIYTRSQLQGLPVIFSGQQTNLRAQVFNNGGATSIDPISKTVYEFVFEDPSDLPDFSAVFSQSTTLSNGDNAVYVEPGSAFGGSGETGCSWIESIYNTVPGKCRVVTPSGWPDQRVGPTTSWQNLGTGSSSTTIDADDYVPGEVVCQTIAIRFFDNDHTAGNNDRRVSEPVCVEVRGNQPLFQVLGGDFVADGSIQSGINTNGTELFGSRGEFGVLSSGEKIYMSSGAGLLDGQPESAGINDWNQLTFSNTALERGNFIASFPPNNITTSSMITDASPLPNPNNQFLTGLASGFYEHSGDVNIRASSIAQDRSLIIYTPGTIVIQGDITLPAVTHDRVEDISQVVLIANRIDISGAVDQLDAWLLTQGADNYINTCSDRPLDQPLNSTICNTRLTVNGHVSTDQLHLRRTAQSDRPDGAAEVFNLRADSLLWAQSNDQLINKTSTVYSVELAPRF